MNTATHIACTSALPSALPSALTSALPSALPSALTSFFLLLFSLPSFATTWNVGPTRTYKMPSEVVSLVQGGDTVMIDAGTYRDTHCEWTTFGISIIGVGRVVLLPDTTQVANSTWTVVGDAYWIGKLEFHDGLERKEPGSGLRILGISCRVDSCVFTRNRRGIDVIETVESSVAIRWSTFADNEDADVSIGGKQSVSVFNSWFRGGTNAVNLRSAAAFHYLYCNKFSNELGSPSTSVHIQAGGYTQMYGNIFRVAGRADSARHIITYDASRETHSGLPNSVVCGWNTFVNDADSISFIEVRGAFAPSFAVLNSIVAGNGTLIKDATDSSGAEIDQEGNYTNPNVELVGFVDRGLYDYHITESSPVRKTTPSQRVQIIGDEYLDPVNNKQRTSCTNVGAFEYESIASVALDQLDHTAIRIAPNPASSSITLSLPPSLIGSEVVIVNMQGSEVARYNIAQIPQQIDIASLSIGMYVVRVGVHSTLLGIVR